MISQRDDEIECDDASNVVKEPLDPLPLHLPGFFRAVISFIRLV